MVALDELAHVARRPTTLFAYGLGRRGRGRGRSAHGAPLLLSAPDLLAPLLLLGLVGRVIVVGSVEPVEAVLAHDMAELLVQPGGAAAADP